MADASKRVVFARAPIPPGDNRAAVRRAAAPGKPLVLLLLAATMLLLGGYVPAAMIAPAPLAASPAAALPATVTSTRARAVGNRPVAGTGGSFRYARGYGRVLGTAGPVRRFRVAVEKPVAPEATEGFAAEVERTLSDSRSWIAGGRFRLRRVPRTAAAEFTVYLASAATSERMCRTGGLETGGYTSCRLPRRVILNDRRWVGAVRGYGAALSVYRAYLVNHEVGHQLGHGHEKCPGRGRPAPVMLQQTYGLEGCVANPWPYRNGRRYAGPSAS